MYSQNLTTTLQAQMADTGNVYAEALVIAAANPQQTSNVNRAIQYLNDAQAALDAAMDANEAMNLTLRDQKMTESAAAFYESARVWLKAQT